MSRSIAVCVGLAAAGLLLAAGEARAAGMTVLVSGSLAEACSTAAKADRSDVPAEQLCSDALEIETLSPKLRASTYVNRGVIKLLRKDWGGALADLDEAVRIMPDIGEIYVNRAASFIAMGRYADGLADVNHALDLGVPDPQKAYYNRAVAYEGLNEPRAAMADYQKALELAPNWEDPKRELARFHVASAP